MQPIFANYYLKKISEQEKGQQNKFLVNHSAKQLRLLSY